MLGPFNYSQMTNSWQYPDDPIVSALALHSGTAPLLTSAPDHQSWNELSTALGCGVGAGSFQCMKQVPMMKIVETRANGSYRFYPIVDNVLVFSDYAARAKMGKLAKLVCTWRWYFFYVSSPWANLVWNPSQHWEGVMSVKSRLSYR